jgi:predicted GIY-YIG superfamily endonuclease
MELINITLIFGTKHTLRGSFLKTRQERDPQQTAKCVYSIPCERCRSYIGETGIPLTVRLCEHRHSLKDSLLKKKSKLAQRAYEEGHSVGWDEAGNLEIECSNRYRKYKESDHMACLTKLIIQPSSDISPIWVPLISNEVRNSQRRSVCCDRFFMGFYNVLVLRVQFYSTYGAISRHKIV